MYLNSDPAVTAVMETHHIGGEYYPEDGNSRRCGVCGEVLESNDDCYIYEEVFLCAQCLKQALFDELSEDYRVRSFL